MGLILDQIYKRFAGYTTVFELPIYYEDMKNEYKAPVTCRLKGWRMMFEDCAPFAFSVAVNGKAFALNAGRVIAAGSSLAVNLPAKRPPGKFCLILILEEIIR